MSNIKSAGIKHVDKCRVSIIWLSPGMKLKDKSIVVFGFGIQGKAQALNLKEGGFNITVCLPETSKSITDVKNAGLRLVTNPVKAALEADIAAFMVPDLVQKGLYNGINTTLPKNAAIVFAHGLNIHYKLIEPREDLDIILVAPLAHGDSVRQFFIEGKKLPALISVHQDATGNARSIAKEYAKGIGASEEKILETTFKEETETDLFVEQALICGGLWKLISSAFETLVEAGYSPDIAYYSCVKEVKILTDLFAKFGIHGTFQRISDTARYGALSRGPRVINDAVKGEMKTILGEIRDGNFFNELEDEVLREKSTSTAELMRKIAEHSIETLHKKLNAGEDV